MSRLTKSVLILFVVAAVLFLALYFLGLNEFTGKYNGTQRNELADNFIRNEKEFLDLVSFFDFEVANKEQRIAFGISDGDIISLIVTPTVINSESKILGGENLKFDSPEMDSVLVALNWTNETVRILRNKLAKTKCNWIRTTNIQTHPIEMFSNQTGWGSYSYLIFKTSLSDSLIQIHGKPISDSEFGRKVALVYSSAL